MAFSFLVSSWILKYLSIPRSHAFVSNPTVSIPPKVCNLAFLNFPHGIPLEVLLHLNISWLHLLPLLKVWESRELALRDTDKDILWVQPCDSLSGLGDLLWVWLHEFLLTLFVEYPSNSQGWQHWFDYDLLGPSLAFRWSFSLFLKAKGVTCSLVPSGSLLALSSCLKGFKASCLFTILCWLLGRLLMSMQYLCSYYSQCARKTLPTRHYIYKIKQKAIHVHLDAKRLFL